MTKEEKLKILAEAMDVEIDVLVDEAALSSFDEWDSLAALSLMSLLSSKLHKKITPAEVKAIDTVSDALNLME
ncbi:MAG: hypothetical protein K6F01_09205 [Selenomonas sp.]|uniref:phosphopantetheine-binding protein n=1 Tax=Selenomonas sp. TaxID=2053611 RepID=UPI0025E105C7|nr:phosphopantetheine-binding protein [Selenomonas sp.]MCR5439592.1 hypothetical protein [Selenomonas sp.]